MISMAREKWWLTIPPFGLGAIIYFTLFKWLQTSGRWFSKIAPTENLLLICLFSFLGGAGLTILCSRVLDYSFVHPEKKVMPLLLRGATYGLLNMIGVFTITFFGVAMVMTRSNASSVLALPFVFIGVFTYGVILIIVGSPLGLSSGVLCALYVKSIQSQLKFPSIAVHSSFPRTLRGGQRALLLALSGAVLIVIPFVGPLLSVAAVVSATRLLMANTTGPHKTLARVALVIGSASLLYALVGFLILLR